MNAITPPTPQNVAALLVGGDNDYHDGNDWWPSTTAEDNVISIGITPVGKDYETKLPEVHFRAVVVEGETTPVLLAGPAYISGDGDGYLYLRCDGCGEIITCIDAGSSLAGLNAEARSHTCATGEVTSDG